jgi:ABC-type glycerol-3-phosphate transport system substrate-binding protein
MKRIAALLLGLLLVCLSVFGGGRNQGVAQSQVGSGMVTLKVFGEDTEYNANGRQVALSDWVSGRVPSRTFERFTKDLEDRNIKLDYDLIKSDQLATTIQTTLASGKLNDYDWFQMGSGMNISTLIQLAQQGRMYAINKAIDAYSSGGAKKYFYEEEPGRLQRGMLTLEDGNFYWLSGITITSYQGGYAGGLQSGMIRYDWLKALGLEMPKTMDDFYNDLVAFRENDMNKNGVKDEVARIPIDGFMNGVAQWFSLGSDMISCIDYKAVSPWYQPHVRDYFTYMQKLYNAGLITVTTEGSEMASNRISYLLDWAAQAWHEPTITVPEGAPRPYYAPFIIKAAADAEPRVWTMEGIDVTATYNVSIIPSGAKHIEAAVRIMDYIVTPEQGLLEEFGIEGYTFTYGADGSIRRIPPGPSQVGVDQIFVTQSRPALWTSSGVFSRFERKRREDDLVVYLERGFNLGYPEGFVLKRDIYVDAWGGKIPYARKINATMAVPTARESERIATLLPDLETYSAELAAGLVIGQKSLNNWNTYIADLKRLGLDELIGIYQARIDRVHTLR